MPGSAVRSPASDGCHRDPGFPRTGPPPALRLAENYFPLWDNGFENRPRAAQRGRPGSCGEDKKEPHPPGVRSPSFRLQEAKALEPKEIGSNAQRSGVHRKPGQPEKSRDTNRTFPRISPTPVYNEPLRAPSSTPSSCLPPSMFCVGEVNFPQPVQPVTFPDSSGSAACRAGPVATPNHGARCSWLGEAGSL